LRGFGYRSGGLFVSRLGNGEQHLTGDRRARLQTVAARLAEVGARADGVEGITRLGAQVLCRRELGCLNGGHDDATFS
jgi:hypothetical protein